MGIPEEAGKVAGNVIEGLKSSPSLLFMMVMMMMLNGIFIGFTYQAMQNQASREHEERMNLLERCFPLRDLRDRVR